MVEVPAAATMARQLARAADFLSIGTNDLSQLELGIDRASAEKAPVHHPAVLNLIAQTVSAGHEAGIPVSVCGEAGSDPQVLPLLIGLGVDEVSVGASRVGPVRGWVRNTEYGRAHELAAAALQAGSAAEVARLVSG
jgi:phosphocarrier protein FPr